MWKEFREFFNRGSVIDLAVVLGGAFTAIVTSLVTVGMTIGSPED